MKKMYFKYTGGETLGVRQRSCRLAPESHGRQKATRRQLRCRTPRRPAGAPYPNYLKMR